MATSPAYVWNSRDWRQVHDLIDKAQAVERFAFEPFSPQFAQLTRKFFSGLGQVFELQEAFRSSPGGAISGPHSVAERLSITRNGVKVRLDNVGLKADDFTVQPAPLMIDLLKKSEVLGPIVHEIEQVSRKLASSSKVAGTATAGRV